MLYIKGHPLITEEDFNNAIYYRLIVSITESGVHCGNYCIKTHNNETVQTMNDQWYDKLCDYTVVGYAAFYEPQLKDTAKHLLLFSLG